MITQTTTTIKPCTTKELAAKYEITPKVLRQWLQGHDKSIGKKVGRYYTIVQIKAIFHLIGEPL